MTSQSIPLMKKYRNPLNCLLLTSFRTMIYTKHSDRDSTSAAPNVFE